jgi:hypothetical protein
MSMAPGRISARSGSSPTTTKTPVRILRGRYRGREGRISGTLADRAARGVTRALVHIDGEEPELLETSSLEEARQLALDLT